MRNNRVTAIGQLLTVAIVSMALAASSPAFGSRQEADRRYEQAVGLYKAQRFADAMPAALQALELHEREVGRETKEVLGDVELLSLIHQRIGEVESAGAYRQRALVLRKKLFGESDPEYLNSLSLAATLHRLQSQWDRADALLREALRIVRQHRPADVEEITRWRLELGGLYDIQGRSQDAREQYAEALSALRQAGRAESDEALEALDHLADSYIGGRQLSQARGHIEQALEIRKKRFGNDHPQYARGLRRLSTVYYDQGEFTRSEKMTLEALRVLRKSRGETDIDYLGTLLDLGRLYQRVGLYDRAEKWLTPWARTVAESNPGEPLLAALPQVALAELYRDQGRFSLAEKHYLESVAVLEKHLPPGHTMTLQAISGLARVYLENGQYPRAEAICRKLLGLQEAALGRQHPAYLSTLNTLAVVCTRTGRLKEALPLLEEVETGTRRLHAAEFHPDLVPTMLTHVTVLVNLKQYNEAEPLWLSLRAEADKRGSELRIHAADILNAGGLLYAGMGDAERAEKHYREALALAAGDVNSRPQLYPTVASNLGLLLARRQRYPEAIGSLCDALERQLRIAERAQTLATEQELLDYLGAQSGTADALLDILGAAKQLPAAPRDRALSSLLRSKGVALEAAGAWRAARQRLRSDVKTAAAVGQLSAVNQRLSNLALTAPDAESGKESAALKEKRRRLEAELNLAFKPEIRSGNLPSVAALRAKLTPGTALVEVYRTSGTHLSKQTLRPRYFAFVLGSDSAPGKTIDLGAADEIDELISELRSAVSEAGRALAGTPKAALAAVERAREQELKATARALHRRIFVPLQPALGSARMLFISPDGELNRLPFEALVDAGGKYLVERFAFAYLSCGRDLLRPGRRRASGVAVFAAPDYDLDGGGAAASPPAAEPAALLSGQLSRDQRGLNWAPLRGTAVEAADIQRAFARTPYAPVQVRTGAGATEGALKRLKAPRLLHIATHGFFLPDQKRASEERDPVAGAGFGAAQGLGRLRGAENPLLRSGLVLASANLLHKRSPDSRGDDGWVTAEEIAMLDLRGTELVVLSACETGLGDIRCGEGVYGLRRAFQYAGARSLVASLFKVPDEATRNLMRDFYGGLKSGKSKLAALHAAQLQALRKRRSSSGAAHPFFWASFVLVGDPQ